MKEGNRQQARGNSKNLTLIPSALCALLFALSLPVQAQQTKKIPRIAYLAQRNRPTPDTPDPAVRAFQQGLRDLGYLEGKNIVIESRYGEGNEDRLKAVVADLLQIKVELIVSPTSQAIRAARQATKDTPIVMVIQADPVAAGLVDSLARPGGNITGVTRLTRELSGKRLELLKEIAPAVSKVGVLRDTEATTDFKEYEIAAAALKIKLQSLDVRNSNLDLEGAFQIGLKRRIDALVVVSGAMTLSHRKRIAELAIRNRLLSMHERREEVEAGGLISYSGNDAESFRRAAVYVDKILKGAKPADLPVEQPTKFEFVINLKTAKQIGVTIPQSVLYQADKVIK